HKRKIPCRKHLYKANGTSEQQEETTTKIDTTRRQTRNDNFSDDISVISPTKLIRNSQSIPLLSTNDSNNYHHEITTTPIASFYNSTSPFYSYKGENNLLLNGNNQNESCSLVDIEVESTNDTTTNRSYTPNNYLTNINNNSNHQKSGYFTPYSFASREFSSTDLSSYSTQSLLRRFIDVERLDNK
ncbi:unnamed protein product, partial [Didymodactylos carnosus]